MNLSLSVDNIDLAETPYAFRLFFTLLFPQFCPVIRMSLSLGVDKIEFRRYTIIVDGHGAVSERRLADHAVGRELNATVTVVSNTVNDGLRTVVMTRSLKGASKDYARYTHACIHPCVHAHS